MKPLKLEIEGVNSFRDKQTIDFEQLAANNLFCISGATGSGKTTILDSLILALYEKLPSSSSRGKVEDYINLRCDRAVIKLTFELEGKLYRSERVISRKAGANTAKLVDVDTGVTIKEKHDETFSFLSEKLGLDVEQFTRVIVLQQGEFSRFLKATKAERNKMIVNLFKLSRFESVPKKFADAEKLLDGQLKQLDQSLSRYENVGAEALAKLKEKKKNADERKNKYEKIIRDLRALEIEAKDCEKKQAEYENAVVQKILTEKKVKELDRRKKVLVENQSKFSEYTQKVEARRIEREGLIERKVKLESDKKQLEDIAIRENELKKRREEYKKASEEATSKKAKADALKKEIEDLVKTVGEYSGKTYAEVTARLSEIKILLSEYKKNESALSETQAKLKEYEIKVEQIKSVIAEQKQTVIVAEKERDDCKRITEQAGLETCADALKRGLKCGDVCPVCGEILSSDPVFSDESKFRNVENDLSRAEEKLKEAEKKLNALEVQRASLETALTAERANEKKYSVSLAAYDLKQMNAETEKLEKAEKTLKKAEQMNFEFVKLNAEADKAVALAEQKLEQGKQNRSELDERKKGIESRSIAEIDAQTLKIADILKAIDEEFLRYEKIKSETEKENNEILKIQAETDASLSVLEKILSEKPKKLEKTSAEYAAEVKKAEDERNEAIVESAGAKAAAERMSEDWEQKKALKSERAELQKKYDRIYDISKAIKGEFNAFVAAEYIKDFTYNASDTLRELTGGKYSLTYDEGEGEFYVTDFLNNNEQRKIKTLSGGETFLASLSMAIALSQEIARYGNFDFFFIDEGFGTLHEQALEQALEVLLRLSRSSLVGIVTHRNELLGRIPMTLLVSQASEDEGSVCRIL